MNFRQINRLFYSEEVRETLAKIDEFKRFIENKQSRSFEIYDAITLVHNKAEKTIIKAKKEVKSQIKNEGQSPREVAFILLVNICGSLLASGNFHEWRGILNDTGKDILQVYFECLQEAKSVGIYSPEEAENLWTDLQRDIASVG